MPPHAPRPSLPPRPGAVLFDLDGVLIDSYRVWFHLINHAARELGCPAVDDDGYRECWGQSTTADRDRFFPGHDVAEVERFYDEHYDEHLDHLIVPESVPHVFERLRELRLPSAVVTNTQSSIAANIVRRAGASPDEIVGSSDVERPKPAPDMVLHASRRLGVPVASAWMIGDSVFDREAAAAAGAFFVGLGIDGDARVEALSELVPLLEDALAGV